MEGDARNAVELRQVTKRFGAVTALQDVSFAATEGEFVAFLGPSGCGKTTLLRILAGFEDPSAGAVLIRGAHVERFPPYSRDIGMVFQHYALFPHNETPYRPAWQPGLVRTSREVTLMQVRTEDGIVGTRPRTAIMRPT